MEPLAVVVSDDASEHDREHPVRDIHRAGRSVMAPRTSSQGTMDVVPNDDGSPPRSSWAQPRRDERRPPLGRPQRARRCPHNRQVTRKVSEASIAEPSLPSCSTTIG